MGGELGPIKAAYLHKAWKLRIERGRMFPINIPQPDRVSVQVGHSYARKGPSIWTCQDLSVTMAPLVAAGFVSGDRTASTQIAALIPLLSVRIPHPPPVFFSIETFMRLIVKMYVLNRRLRFCTVATERKGYNIVPKFKFILRPNTNL